MADFNFAPVATQIKPPEPIRLADMVNTASAMQQYQQAQQVNPLALQQAQQQVEQSKIATQKAGMGLAGDRMKAISDSQISMINNPLIVAAEQDPNSVDKNALAELIKRNGYQTADALGIPKDQADKLIQPYLQIADQNPAAVRGYFKERHLQGLDAGARTSAMTPTMREVTGFGPQGEKLTQQVNVNPFAGPIGAPIGGTQSFAGPGQPMTPTGRVDAAGNPTAYVADPQSGKIREVTIPAGGFSGGGQAGGGAGAGGPDLNAKIPGGTIGGRMPPPPIPANEEYEAPKRISPAGGQAAIDESQKLFTDARKSANEAGNVINTSNRIVDLASQVVAGKGAGVFASLGGGYAALPWNSNITEAYNRLGHDIALQTQNMAQSGAYGTDAGRELASELAGKREWDEKSIQSVSRLNRAMATSSQLFANGIENAAQMDRANPTVASDFRSKWTKTMGNNGLDTLRLWDAYQNLASDPGGLDEVKKELGGEKSARFKAAFNRIDDIFALVRGQ